MNTRRVRGWVWGVVVLLGMVGALHPVQADTFTPSTAYNCDIHGATGTGHWVCEQPTSVVWRAAGPGGTHDYASAEEAQAGESARMASSGSFAVPDANGDFVIYDNTGVPVSPPTQVPSMVFTPDDAIDAGLPCLIRGAELYFGLINCSRHSSTSYTPIRADYGPFAHRSSDVDNWEPAPEKGEIYTVRGQVAAQICGSYGYHYDSLGNYVAYCQTDAYSLNIGGLTTLTSTDYVATPVDATCPEGAELRVDGGTRKFFVCVHTPAHDLVDGGCGCDSVSADGGGTVGNPVQLSTGAKVDHVVDYTNGSPFPIVWERYYHSQKNAGWHFGYDRSLSIVHTSGGVDQAAVHRPDGVVIRFSKTTGAAGAWTPDMGLNQGILATLTTVMNVGATAVDHYEYKTLSDEVEWYTPAGQLAVLTDRAGRALTFTYASGGAWDGKLTRIDDDAGRYLEMTYGLALSDGTVPLASVSDGDKTVSYTFTALSSTNVLGSPTKNVQLTDVEQSDGTHVSYVYGQADLSGHKLLTGVVDEDAGTYATYAYTTDGVYDTDGTLSRTPRITDSRHGAASQVLNYAYTSSWSGPVVNMSWVKDPATGSLQTAVFDTSPSASGIAKTAGSDNPCPYCGTPSVIQTIYDTYGNPVSQTGFNGSQTDRTYDTARGLVLTETEGVNGIHPRTTTWTWDSTFRLPLTKVEPIATDAGDGTRTTTWTYDTNGTLLSETVAPDTGEAARTRSWTYNAQAQPLTATDARSHTTTYTYDGDFNLSSATDALAHTTTYTNHTAQGRVGTVTDPNGLQTVITYDDRQRPTEIKRGTSGTHWETTTIAYAAIGKLHRVDLPNGFWAEYVYNDAHDLVEIDTRLGKRLFTLDGYGHVLTEETQDASGNPLETHSQVFDGAAHLASVTNGNGNTTQTQYNQNGTLGAVTHPDSTAVYQAFDEFDRLRYATDENYQTTRYDYDVSDGLVSVSDPAFHTTTYHRNGFGEVVQIDSPDTGTTTVTRDANGNPLVTTDARGATATRTYDALDRVTQVVFAGPSMTTETQTFTYDSCTNGIGHLCSMTDQSGTTGYTYDLWGRVTGKAFVPAAAPSLTLSVGYAYDNSGRLTATTYPSGKILTQSWTSETPTGLTWDGTSVLSSVGYRPFGGAVTGWTWGASLGGVAFSYDLNGQVSSIQDVDQRDYTFDNRERITQVDDPADATQQQTYAYDPTSRLTSATLAAWPTPFTYGYDGVGNRLYQGTSSATTDTNDPGYPVMSLVWKMDPSSNRMLGAYDLGSFDWAWQTGTQAHPWTLDASGNLVDDGAGLTLAYGPTGRMASSAKGSFSTSYAVNALGQRAFKEVATSPGPTLAKEFSVYDEQGRLLGRYDGTGAALEELVYLDGFRPVATVRGSAIHRVLTDHLGTPRKVMDPTGATVWSWDSKEPFGNSAPVGVGGFTFDLRFPGQILDPETGLVHNGFREYHPGVGRYVESDPLGLGGGVNTYAYAASNPESMTDPSGLKFGVGFDTPVGRSALARIALSPTGAALISMVEKDPRTLNLILGDADFHLNSYWDGSNPGNAGYSYIYWSPNAGVRCVKTREILSPAVQLAHEMQHFLQNANPGEAVAMRENRLDWTSWVWENYLRGSVGAYGNELEYDAIMVEQRVARDLGEFVRKSGFEKIDGVPYYEAVNYDN